MQLLFGKGYSKFFNQLIMKQKIKQRIQKANYPITLLFMEKMGQDGISISIHHHNGTKYIQNDFYKPICSQHQ